MKTAASPGSADAPAFPDEPLARSTIALYALPSAGLMAMQWLVLLYLLKFSTEVLGLAPALVGTIFAAGRIWDAVSDPLAGWASDRTRSRMGRRRPWMFASALPLGIGFYALWSPPVDVSPTFSALWLGALLLVFYSGQTAFNVPYLSLGAELSPSYHERTRISAARVAFDTLGMIAGVAGLHFLENAGDPRMTASVAAGAIACVSMVAIVYASLHLREPRDHVGRGAANPLRAVADVARNPHALRITVALFCGEIGLGSLMVAIPFASEIFYDGAGSSARMLSGFLMAFAIAVGAWVPLARRFGKHRCWLAATLACALGFFGVSFVEPGDTLLILCLTIVIGAAQAGMRILPQAVKADVIDWDEARTGERKEGTHFALWNLLDKLAGGVSVAIVGFAIQGANGGIDPEGVRFVMSTLPAALLALACFALFGFRLDEPAHAALRARLDQASALRGQSSPTRAERRDRADVPRDVPELAVPAIR